MWFTFLGVLRGLFMNFGRGFLVQTLQELRVFRLYVDMGAILGTFLNCMVLSMAKDFFAALVPMKQIKNDQFRFWIDPNPRCTKSPCEQRRDANTGMRVNDRLPHPNH